MALSRQKKEELVGLYQAKLEESPAVVITKNSGATVAQLQSLRGDIKPTESTYMIIKNSLFKIALENLGRTSPDELLNGANAAMFTGEDISSSYKALRDALKRNDKLEISGALMESSVITGASVDGLADLPTKEQTRAMLLAALVGPSTSLVRMINAPANSLARVVNGPAVSLLNVLNAHIEKQKSEAA